MLALLLDCDGIIYFTNSDLVVEVEQSTALSMNIHLHGVLKP